MKDKISDDTSHIDSLPEDKQEPEEKGKIKLLDVVALTEDIPEHNLKRGEVGTVVEILANGEAFEVEFSDDNGQMYKCTSFLASQLEVFHQEPIKADSKRQASDSIEGYRYQILHSVNAWLDLADNDILYLEVAEDLDIESDGTFTATQVKHTQDNITLRSKQVIDGINNYWELRTNNPDRRVKFRLLTKSKVVKEQGNPLGTDKPGLEVWSRCSGDEAAITKISEFLQTDGKISAEVNDLLKTSSPQEIYEQLIDPITWDTDNKPSSFVEESIRKKLVYHGDRHGISPSQAKDIVEPLIIETWKVAGQPENRELTRLRFLEIFEEKTKRLVSEQHLQHLETLAAMKGAIGTGLIGGPSDITVQSHLHIQTDIPPLYLDIVVPRTDLLTEIQTNLQSDGIVVIQGGVDTGKTTLAKLTVNAIDVDWFWMKFTNKEASQIVQELQQLAEAVNNRSAQVNVVLDDLNLQPQMLQAYEEDLGIVVYSVLERGAKLLITSQYKPHNNFIRNLGLSSLVIINVPNFTISEIEQFAQQLGCPEKDAKTWAELFQFPTRRHPSLVHALLTHLREKNWEQQDVIKSILHLPQEVVEEHEAARQLLMDLPEDRREFLYRLSLLTEFRKDYAINIGEIPESIAYPGDVFNQLVGPWIDQVSETYYTISPLLKNAANEVWSKSKINDLHAEVANAILKANNLTTTEARAVLTHSMVGQNEKGFLVVVQALMTAPKDNWKEIGQEFSWLTHVKTNPPEELFPGNAFVNHVLRLLQYRVAVEVEPQFAPKILEVLDKETKPYEPYQIYQLLRLMLAKQVLIYYQVSLPAKQLVDYLTEIIDIIENNKEVEDIFGNLNGQLREHKTEKSNYFSILFGFIYARQPMYAPFLNDLIDALDELDPKTRSLLLADFEDDTIDPRVLVDGVWRSEAKLENPNWTRCLQVFDKVIEKTIVWGYPHFAAAAARAKAIIYDENRQDPDTAHQILQDFVSKVGSSPIIQEEQAVIYLHQERYKDALNIYERILPDWNPPSGQLDVMPPEGCRRAAMCAAHLGDWKKAAIFFGEGAKRINETVNAERYVSFCADAGFAHFKAGNMLNCIKLLHLALQKFETLPQDNTNVKYFTLKERLVYTTRQIVAFSQNNVLPSEIEELPAGFCSNPETNEKVLDLPDSPIGETWVNLAQIEYKFGRSTTAFERALQITDRKLYPGLDTSLSLLETQYDFRNKTFDNLPQRIYQLARAFVSMQKHDQSGKGIGEKGVYSISNSDLSDFASVEKTTIFFVSALLTQLSTNRDFHEILTVWRTNSVELPIKENIFIVLDLIESILSEDCNQALTVMKTKNTKAERQLAASLKVVVNKETNLANLFHAHTFIASSLFDHEWLEPVAIDFGKMLSLQWLEKIKNGEMALMNINIVQQIEQACNSSEVGKKKIGQILLAAYPVVTTMVDTQVLQQLRAWTESESK